MGKKNVSPAVIQEEHTVMTVKEARKIMGKNSNIYTDDQLKKLIEDLDMIAKLQFDLVPN